MRVEQFLLGGIAASFRDGIPIPLFVREAHLQQGSNRQKEDSEGNYHVHGVNPFLPIQRYKHQQQNPISRIDSPNNSKRRLFGTLSCASLNAFTKVTLVTLHMLLVVGIV
jgi:hypothetical protein